MNTYAIPVFNILIRNHQMNGHGIEDSEQINSNDMQQTHSIHHTHSALERFILNRETEKQENNKDQKLALHMQSAYSFLRKI